MDLKRTLASRCDLLNSDELENEAQVKQSVINPILRALGWDDADLGMVKLEYKVDSGKVDYALLYHGTALVFIEAKRTGVSLVSGEDQLFGYAAHKGVPILILTDGQWWDLYLSMAPGMPKQRRFFQMDLANRRDISENAENLERFVQRDRVVSGQSRRSAERILESVRLRERVRRTFPRVWKRLLKDPDQQLRSLLSQAIAADCGTMPEPSDVTMFLGAQVTGIVVPKEFKIYPPPPLPPPPPPPGRIVGFEFKGERYEPGTGVHTLARVIQLFDELNSEFMPRLERRTIGRTRKLVARERSELYKHSHLVKHSKSLGNGWWLGTNMSLPMVRQRIETACEVAGVKFGTELTLIER